MAYFSSAQVLKKIGCKHLELVKGEGYWYFVYDNLETKKYETRSVFVFCLNHMPIDRWVHDGLEFVKDVEAQ